MGKAIRPPRRAVLVVEDEPLLLADAMDLAQDAGFLAYGVRNAARAIELLESRPEICILFTDIRMSGPMDGLALARAVRGRWPPVAIMVTSGVVSLGPGDLPEGCLFFSKPYAPKAIVQAMSEVAARLPD